MTDTNPIPLAEPAQQPNSASRPQLGDPTALPRAIKVGTREVKLTTAEAAVFYQLYLSEGEVCGRKTLQDAVRHYVGGKIAKSTPDFGTTGEIRDRGTVDAFVFRIRKKLGESEQQNEIDRQNFPSIKEMILSIRKKHRHGLRNRGERTSEDGYMLNVPRKYSLSLANGVFLLQRNTAG